MSTLQVEGLPNHDLPLQDMKVVQLAYKIRIFVCPLNVSCHGTRENGFVRSFRLFVRGKDSMRRRLLERKKNLSKSLFLCVTPNALN